MTANFPTTHPEPLPPASPADALLRGEDAHAYDQLRRRFVAEMRPRDVVEEVLVGDVCDLVWEAARYRRIRARALEARMHLGVAAIVEPHESSLLSRGIAEGWARRQPGAVETVDKCLAVAGLGPEHVAACTFLAQIGTMERLDRMIALAETRRAAALREIERHRAARTREGFGAGAVEDVAQYAEVDAAERTAAVSADCPSDATLRQAGRARCEADADLGGNWRGLA